MSFFRRIDPYTCSPLIVRETSNIEPSSFLLGFPSFIDVDEVEDLDFPLDLLETVTDLVSPSSCKYQLIRRRLDPDYPLQYLCERVSELETKFDRLFSPKSRESDRKYTLTKEIKGSGERKYKWEAEIQGPPGRKYKVEAEGGGSMERKYKWETEIEGPGERKYKWTSEIKGGKKDEVVALTKAFARRNGAVRTKKGKNKEMSYEYAAVVIQRAFRAYVIRRSKTLRALRDLAIAKTKLKELRASFHNFSYRRLIDRDAEERQKFSEKIIVLLLTVDAIEGVDVMVRGAKRSMVDELEAMLDVVDPQPQGKSLSMRRRTFDMPDSLIRKEIAEGVTQIVQMLETEE
ncbi:unnamed protein product [Arabis nemorensis]|uniref:BAG domain-containing protein n=1 Tax=Arabis nemorensis TaxID=586526 RepID=A0A565CVW2_9BRAS|nr:unnamed protein product [Arabis nemorensis]